MGGWGKLMEVQIYLQICYACPVHAVLKMMLEFAHSYKPREHLPLWITPLPYLGLTCPRWAGLL